MKSCLASSRTEQRLTWANKRICAHTFVLTHLPPPSVVCSPNRRNEDTVSASLLRGHFWICHLSDQCEPQLWQRNIPLGIRTITRFWAKRPFHQRQWHQHTCAHASLCSGEHFPTCSLWPTVTEVTRPVLSWATDVSKHQAALSSYWLGS